MNLNIIILILGMSLVTYVPRALPAVLIDKMNFNPSMEKFLRLIPYTAMAALVFPAVINVDPSHIEIGLIGALVAGVLACKKLPVMVVVIAAIIADILLYTFAF